MLIQVKGKALVVPYLTFGQLMTLDRIHNVLEVPDLVFKVSEEPLTPEEMQTLKVFTMTVSSMIGTDIAPTNLPQILVESLYVKDRSDSSESGGGASGIPFHKFLANFLKAQIPIESLLNRTLFDVFEISYHMTDKKNESQKSVDERIAAFEAAEKKHQSK